jgi:NAD(P)-dependent dehydrogenase (short-subunit alcohol dehydrogenase family)
MKSFESLTYLTSTRYHARKRSDTTASRTKTSRMVTSDEDDRRHRRRPGHRPRHHLVRSTRPSRRHYWPHRFQLDNTAAEIHAKGASATALVMDVTDEASVASAFGSLHGRVKHVDVLVNNAGTGGGVQGSDVARWKRPSTPISPAYLVTRQFCC